jgi:hypothetical protein
MQYSIFPKCRIQGSSSPYAFDLVIAPHILLEQSTVMLLCKSLPTHLHTVWGGAHAAFYEPKLDLSRCIIQ